MSIISTSSPSALNWYKSADPRPDYYRYLPSYYEDQDVKDLYTHKWLTDESFSQINWDALYQANYLNNLQARETGVERGSTYILERRHSNQLNTSQLTPARPRRAYLGETLHCLAPCRTLHMDGGSVTDSPSCRQIRIGHSL